MDIFDNKRKFPVNPKNFDEFKKAIKDLDRVLDNFSKGLAKDADVFMKYQDVINNLIKTINNFNRTNKYKLKGTTLDGDYFNLSEKNVPGLRKSLALLKEAVAEENYILELEKEKTREKEKQKKLDEQIKRQNRLNAATQKNLNGLNNYYNYYLNNDRQNFSNTLRGIGSTIFGNQLQTEAEIRDKVSQRVVKEYTKQGKTGPKYYKEMMSAINERVDDDLAYAGINHSAKELQSAANLLNAAGELLVTGISSITKLFTQGMSRQVKIYEDTFAGIAARTGMSRSGYFNAQLNTMSDLSSRGMLDNVGVSEVQEMWNKLSQKGMNETSILINGIENVITEKVVPYLDTSTLSFNLLNSRLNNQFVKDIRGISLANQELANNNYLTQDLLQKIIDEVQPMSDKAIEDLALNSTESIAMLNKLMLPRSEGGAGLSEGQAKEYLTNAFQLQKYRSQTMRNGSTYEKYLATEAQRLGINDTAGLINLGVGTSTMFGNMAPNYDTNPLEASIFAEGIYGSNSYDLAMAGQKLQGVYSSNFFSDILNMTPEQLQNYNDEAAKKLGNGEYNTATQMQEYLTENIATPVATIAEQVGTFGRDILSTLKTLVTAYLGGKIAGGIASALGVGGAGSGIGTLLSAAGPIALGIGGVAAIGAAIYSIENKKKHDEWANERSRIANESAAYAAEHPKDNANISGIIGAVSSGGFSMEGNYDSSGGIIGTINARNRGLKPEDWKKYSRIEFGDLSDTELAEYGIKKDAGLTREQEYAIALKNAENSHSWETYNKLKLAFMRAQHQDENYLAKIAVALLIQNKYSKNIKDINSAFSGAISSELGVSDFSDEGILSILEHYNITKAQDILNVVSDLKNNDIFLNDGRHGGNGWIGYGQVTKEHLAEFNLHRQGLSTVPYDEYPALLHAGETIMTASTTATMESMIQAFRNSQNQNYRLDAAIQEQTAQLIAKIDEVINAIGSKSGGILNTNTPSERLRESLRTLTSPLAFQG